MKRFAALSLAAALLAAGFAGCEWGSSSNDKSWSDSFNWVNFSGEYRSSGSKSVTKTNTKTQGTTTTESTSTSSVLTGSQVYTVIHQGQHLTITDGRTSAVYEGHIGSMRSASGYENSKVQGVTGASQTVKSKEDHALPPGDDTIIATFEASGDNGRMVGTFQGRVFDTNTDGKGDVFGARTMTATLVGPTSVSQIEASCMGDSSINIFYPSTNQPVASASE